MVGFDFWGREASDEGDLRAIGGEDACFGAWCGALGRSWGEAGGDAGGEIGDAHAVVECVCDRFPIGTPVECGGDGEGVVSDLARRTSVG